MELGELEGLSILSIWIFIFKVYISLNEDKVWIKFKILQLIVKI